MFINIITIERHIVLVKQGIHNAIKNILVIPHIQLLPGFQ